jgi:hypothetical protein
VELLPGGQAHTRFELDVFGEVTLLRAAEQEQPFWRRATPAERIAALEQWASTTPPGTPDVPAESLRREEMYD